MKFIKTLLGKQEETPKWDIKPPSERPAPRKATEFEEPPPVVQPKGESNPFLDDASLDTMSLEAEAIPEDNPYETHTWESNLENDARKLRTVQIGEATEKAGKGQFNPYDTGSNTRGWKK